jgi:NADH dehydrogenase
MILVTGGAGVMGSRLVRGLVSRGWGVRALTLPGDPWVSRLADVDCELVYADIADPASLDGAFDGVQTVYHLAAVILSHDPAVFQRINIAGTRNVLRAAAAAGARHFIHISSVSVRYPHPTPYSLSKRECERLVREQKRMAWTIVRPSLAYGPNGGQEFMLFMEYLKKFPVVPFIGRGRALKNPVHVDDLMRGFLAIAGNLRTHGKTYHFTGGEEITIWDLAHLMLRLQGIRKPFLPVPVVCCRALARVMAAFMRRPPLTWNIIAGITQDANPDHTAATEDLGYRPIGVSEGLKRCFSV